MASNHQDPFLQVQADVLSLLTNTRSIFSSYIRIRSSATSPTSPELLDAHNELEENLQDLSADLQDLIASVKAIEHDPYRYGIELDEVERRRRLVSEVGGEIEDMRDELNKKLDDVKGKGAANGNGAGNMLPDPDSFEDEDGYAAFEQERQMEIMQEQDQQLDGVFRTVGNLRQQADVMGRELEEQTEMLKETETVADRVGDKVKTGMKKVGWVIRNNEDRWSSCCIAVLIFVLILLLVLLLIV